MQNHTENASATTMTTCPVCHRKHDKAKCPQCGHEVETVSFTPGPWEFVYGSVYKCGKDVRIALMDRDEPQTEPCERDANARLIAAAPELLEACRAALSFLDENHLGGTLLASQLDAAIVKAQGAGDEKEAA